MKSQLVLILSFAGCLLFTLIVDATETENLGIRVLPAPASVVVDGKFADWDLSGGIFACGDVEQHRDKFSLWFHARYDAENLYLLARFNDQTPLNNPGDTKLEFGWNGDSLQVRVVTGYGTPQQQKGVLNAWRGRDGHDVVEFDSPPRTKHSPKGDDIKPLGARQAFQARADGQGYVQEIAVPWKLLTQDGISPKVDESIVITIEPNFTLGAEGRLSIKDIFRPGMVVRRFVAIYVFRSVKWLASPPPCSLSTRPTSIHVPSYRQEQVHCGQRQLFSIFFLPI